ncbi:MAG: pseudouridine-5'-phosphate glycosidase, partial [Termitinemataceae bacterium]
IEQALREARQQGIKGKESTPFLLAKIVELTGGKSLEANIALVLNNARLAAQISAALSNTNRTALHTEAGPPSQAVPCANGSL